jgi:hypothetical protein
MNLPKPLFRVPVLPHASAVSGNDHKSAQNQTACPPSASWVLRKTGNTTHAPNHQTAIGSQLASSVVFEEDFWSDVSQKYNNGMPMRWCEISS